LKKLEVQFYDRDKPFYMQFGEELVNHKAKTNQNVETMKRTSE